MAGRTTLPDAYAPRECKPLQDLYDKKGISGNPEERARYLAEDVLKLSCSDHAYLIRIAKEEGNAAALNFLEELTIDLILDRWLSITIDKEEGDVSLAKSVAALMRKYGWVSADIDSCEEAWYISLSCDEAGYQKLKQDLENLELELMKRIWCISESDKYRCGIIYVRDKVLCD